MNIASQHDMHITIEWSFGNGRVSVNGSYATGYKSAYVLSEWLYGFAAGMEMCRRRGFRKVEG